MRHPNPFLASCIELEAGHHLNHKLVFFRWLRYAVIAVEVFLIVQADVRNKGLVDAEGGTGCDTRTFVVGDFHCSAFVLLAVKIAYSVAVVVHEVVADEWRHLREEFIAQRNVVVYECIDGVYGVESSVVVVLVEVFQLHMPVVRMVVGACIVHHHRDIVGLYLLGAQSKVESMWKKDLRLCGLVDVIGPEIFLVRQS